MKNNKIRVLHVLSSSRYSGAENVACTIIKNLSNEYELFYCSPKGKIELDLLKQHIQYVLIDKLDIHSIREVIEKVKPDIIHAHDHRAAFICALAKKKTKLIIHIHNNNPWLKKKCINSVIFLFSALRAKSVLVVSNSILEEYVFSKRIRHKTIIVGNPSSRNSILAKVKNIKQEKLYDICCVARVTKQKNPNKFIDIVKELKKEMPKIKAIWIGDGDMLETAKQSVHNLGLDKTLMFAGYKKNPYDYISKSKVFLLTSDWEGFGLVAYESIALGVPCVVSKVGGLVDIIDDSCGKLCDSNSRREYVEECKKLLSDKTYYNKKSAGAIRKSTLLDNEKKYPQEIARIYSDIIKTKKETRI